MRSAKRVAAAAVLGLILAGGLVGVAALAGGPPGRERPVVAAPAPLGAGTPNPNRTVTPELTPGPRRPERLPRVHDCREEATVVAQVDCTLAQNAMAWATSIWHCIIYYESRWDPRAVSPTQDYGLTQLHITNLWLLYGRPWWDPVSNVAAAIRLYWAAGHSWSPWSTARLCGVMTTQHRFAFSHGISSSVPRRITTMPTIQEFTADQVPCSRCGELIMFVPHIRTGESAPINVAVALDGNIEPDGVRYRIVAPAERAANPQLRHKNHFATCPFAGAFRKQPS